MGQTLPMIDVAAITSGSSVPSRRFRVAQHVDRLGEQGVRVSEFPPRIEKYAAPPMSSNPRIGRLASSPAAKAAWSIPKLATRVPGVLGTWRADITWLQREMLPGYASLEFLTKRPWVFDVDDAIWLGPRRAGRAVAWLSRRAEVVLAGNEFIASWCSAQGAQVRIVPTAVDTARYRPGPPVRGTPPGRLVLGWIGTSANLPYLGSIEPALAAFLHCSDAELLIVTDRRPNLPLIGNGRLRWQPWSEDTEVAAIQSMDIGLMPLGSDEWSEGKCALKMLQYLSCEVPALVSSTAMTDHVLSLGELGTALEAVDEWFDALVLLRDRPSIGHAIGVNGRQVVKSSFGLEHVGDLIAETFHSFA